MKTLKIKEEKRLLKAPKEKKIIEKGEIAIDFYEKENFFIILAAIGGIRKEDLKIKIENGILEISGYRENPEKEKIKKYYFRECFWGPFFRKILLPEEIDIEKAEAFFFKGILKIKIPKTFKVKKKTLKIKGEN